MSALSGVLIRKSVVRAGSAGGLRGGRLCWSAAKLPSSFLPDEDQGYFYVNVQLPNAASLQRTDEVMRES